MRVIGLDRCVPGSSSTRRGETVGGFTFGLESHVAFLEHVAASYPREACGLASGERDGENVRVVAYHPVRNLARERDRFDLDPEDVVRIEGLARERGSELVAVCHSHPDAPAVPSREDVRGAWPGLDLVIAEVRSGGVTDQRAYRLSREPERA